MNFILKGIIFLLVTFIIFQMIRAIELSAQLSGRKDEVTDKSNNINGWLSLFFGIGYMVFFYFQVKWWNKLTLQDPASEHGVAIDQLWDTTMGLILVVCLLLQPILFFFIWKYRGNKKRKASFITHNNKLEIFWTAIPTIVLSILIFYGLSVWADVTKQIDENPKNMPTKEERINDVKNKYEEGLITEVEKDALIKEIDEEIKEPVIIELYSRQFDWTARYAGKDNMLGLAHVSAIHEDIEDPSANNPLGVITISTMDNQIDAIKNTIRKDSIKMDLEHDPVKKKQIQSRIEDNIEREKRYTSNKVSAEEKGLLGLGEDDILIPSGAGKLVLPVNKEVLLKFRSQDVIHSAYLPHFRVQMNCVPGLSTQFAFTPTMTTEEYREYIGDPNFSYILLCNKICGNSHYNMYMEVEVKTEEDYRKWLSDQIDLQEENELKNTN